VKHNNTVETVFILCRSGSVAVSRLRQSAPLEDDWSQPIEADNRRN